MSTANPASRPIRTTTIRVRNGAGHLVCIPSRWRFQAQDLTVEVSQKCCLDIGFGNGEALWSAAQRHPDWQFFGVELYPAGIRSLVRQLEEKPLENLRMALIDARELLATLPNSSLQALTVFFPDPWPKLRHRKRRLVNADFLRSVSRVLSAQGYFHLATDWIQYAEQVRRDMQSISELRGLSEAEISLKPAMRAPSAFARRAEREGRSISDILAVRSDDR